MPAQAGIGQMPQANQLPTNTRFTIYGIQTTETGDALFALNSFEVHSMVDAGSPCFIDKGQTATFPGLHSSMYSAKIAEVTGITDYRNPPSTATEEQKIDAATAEQRKRNIESLANGLKAVTSASDIGYPSVAAACPGSDSQLPPINCIDEQSNANRLKLCEATWKANPDLWEGTDRVLTAPLNGTTYGMVDGVNPINLAPIGGASFNIDEAISGMDAYAIYYRSDTGLDPGNLLLYGTPTRPTRGVDRVHMTSIVRPTLTAELAIFADLGQDDEHF
jgi:hypothetical protein